VIEAKQFALGTRAVKRTLLSLSKPSRPNPQDPKALTKGIDLARGARLGGLLAVFGKLRAPKCGVALDDELRDLWVP
jgi:hypothetical protein